MTIKVSEERFKKSEPMGLFEALALAQGEFEQVVFDKRSHFGGYATVSAIRKAVQPSLCKYGIAIIQPWEHLPNGDMIVHTRILHKSGEQITSSCLISRGTKTDQQFGASITYTRRYQLASVLSIYAEEDDDGEKDKELSEKKKLDEQKERILKKEAEKKAIFMNERRIGEIKFFLDYLPAETLSIILKTTKVSSLEEMDEVRYNETMKWLKHQMETLKCK